MKGMTSKGPIAVVGTLLLILGALFASAIAEADDPGITVDPASGVPNTPLTVAATGFPTGTPISITYGGQEVATGTTTETGSITTLFNAALTSFGPVTVAATAGTSTTSTLFTLLGPGGIIIDPISGVPNTTISVTGSLFPASTAYSVTFGSTTVLTGTTTAAGGIAGSFAAPLADFGNVSVMASAGGESGSNTFKLFGPASIMLNGFPSTLSGHAGDVVTVTGANFAATSTIALTYDGAAVSTTPAVVTTNGSGAFSATFVVPTPSSTADLGDNLVVATDSMGQSDDLGFELLGVMNGSTYYATIQAAINAASTTTPATLIVGQGSYDENINIDRALTLKALNRYADTSLGLSQINGGLTGTSAVMITASNVTLNGFILGNYSHSTISSVVMIHSGLGGISILGSNFQCTYQSFPTDNCILVEGNTLTGLPLSINIESNRIVQASGAGIRVDSGNTSVTVKNNLIQSHGTGIVLGPAVTSLIRDNNISSNTLGVSNPGPSTASAGGNWWGTNIESAINALMVGFVDFTPYLDTSTNSSSKAFAGDFSTLHVTALGGQTGTAGRVQEGVNEVSGSTVLVHPGTYAEAVTIGKSLVLKSTGGSGLSTINSTGKGTVTITVTAANVTIGGVGVGFTLTGSSTGVLATNAANLKVIGNTISPVGSTGVDATNAPGTQIVGGTISMSGTLTSTGVRLRTSDNSTVSGTTITIAGGATSTAVWVSQSANTLVTGVNAGVVASQSAWGVRAVDATSTTIRLTALDLHAGITGVGISLVRATNSTVQNNAVAVDSTGAGIGVEVIDSSGVVITDNGGIGTLHSVAAGFTVAAMGPASGAKLTNSPNASIINSFFDIFTELSIATGASLMNSPGGTIADSFFDVFTELSVDGLSLVGSGNSTVARSTVHLEGGTGSGFVAVSSTELFVVDSFFDVFFEIAGNGGVLNGSPDSSVQNSEFVVHGALGMTGISVNNSPGTEVDGGSIQVDAGPSAPIAEHGTIVRMTNSANGIVNGVSGTVVALNAVGIDVSSAPGTSAPTLIALNQLHVTGVENATGVRLFNAGGSALYGNQVLVWTANEGAGMEVHKSPGTIIAEVPGSEVVIVKNVVTVTGLAMVAGATVTPTLDSFMTGTGILVDASTGTVINLATVSVLDPVEGIGILVLGSPNVSVNESVVAVMAVEGASGVVVADGSHNFALSASSIRADADDDVVGVFVSGSDQALIGPKAGTSGPGNTISALAHPLPGMMSTHESRNAAGVVLVDAKNGKVVGNVGSTGIPGISAVSEILHDGMPWIADSVGVVGLGAPGLIVSNNTIKADSGKELAVASPSPSGAVGELASLFQQVKAEAVKAGATSLPGVAGAMAESAGVWVVLSPNSHVNTNTVWSLAHLSLVTPVVVISEGVSRALGIGVVASPLSTVEGNMVRVEGDVETPLQLVSSSGVGSLASTVVDGSGHSVAFGVQALGDDGIVIQSNNVAATATTMLAVIAGVFTGTSPMIVGDWPTPSSALAAQQVAKSGAEARGLPVSGLGNNKFANAWGTAEAMGVEIIGALNALVSSNVITADSDVSVTALAGATIPGLSSIQATAVGEAIATGVHALATDKLQIINNSNISAQADGVVLGESHQVLTSSIPVLGPFGLADMHAEAQGVVVEGSKKVVIANNGVNAHSFGIATAAGAEQIIKPALAQGWGFGTADAEGIIGLGVDTILVRNNHVSAGGQGYVVGLALQSGAPSAAAEAAASGWGYSLGIGIGGSEHPVIELNNVDSSNMVTLDTVAQSMQNDASLAQSVVQATGIMVGMANRPDVLSNTVTVLGASKALPRDPAKPVEWVRQCHIEAFATGIEVIGAPQARILGNNVPGEGLPVTAIADCESGVEFGDGVTTAHPEVTNLAAADAAGIFLTQSPQSTIDGNAVSAEALALGTAKAIINPPPPGPAPAGVPVIGVSMSEAMARGITVISSGKTEVGFNHVSATPRLTVTAISANTDTVPAAPSTEAVSGLSARAIQLLAHGGVNVAEVSGRSLGEGIGVWRSMDSLVKNNNVNVGSHGVAIGVSNNAILGGEAFTFGSVVALGFGIMAENISDGTWIVDNAVGVNTHGDLSGLAQAITKEDPLVLGTTIGVAIGIDNYDSFFTLINGNNVGATAGSHGSAFAHELVVPLEAEALQVGLSVAAGIQVAASVDVEVSENTVKADSGVSAVAIAWEELLPSAFGLSVAQSQAFGITVLPFPADSAAAMVGTRVTAPAAASDPAAKSHVWSIQILDNHVLSATASSFALAAAHGVDTPSDQLAAAFSTAHGIDALGVLSSDINGNTVDEVWAKSDTTNIPPAMGGASATSTAPAPVTEVAQWQSTDIYVGGSIDTAVAHNNVSHGPSQAGIWIDHGHVILVTGNNVMHHKWGIAVDMSADVAVEQNTVSANMIGVDILNGHRISANFNNIAGNEKGLRYTVDPYVEDAGAAFHSPSLPVFAPVDATYNWWGAVTGPSGLGSGTGDSVAFRILDQYGSPVPTGPAIGVVFSPWLTAEAHATLADGLGHLGFQRDRSLTAGWVTLSTPIALQIGATTDTDWSRLGNIITNASQVNTAAIFNAETQTWQLVTPDYQLKPLDGVELRMDGPSQARFIASTDQIPATKRVFKNWNLAGYAAPLEQIAWPLDAGSAVPSAIAVAAAFARPPLANVFGRASFFQPMGVRQALVTIEVAGTTNVPGWNQVLSPAGNAASWVFTFNQPGSQPALLPFEAYWIQMENPDDLGGFNSKPGLPAWGHMDD